MFSLTLSMMQYSLPKREQPLKLEGTMSSFIKLLPFEPTNAQLKAMEEIRRNLAGERLMNRLLPMLPTVTHVLLDVLEFAWQQAVLELQTL